MKPIASIRLVLDDQGRVHAGIETGEVAISPGLAGLFFAQAAATFAAQNPPTAADRAVYDSGATT